jgi:hypothetical protein
MTLHQYRRSDLLSHFSAGHQLMLDARNSARSGELRTAVARYDRARMHFVESHAEGSRERGAACGQAIAALRQALAGEQVDLIAATHPDLGHVDTTQARLDAAELQRKLQVEAAKIAAYNIRVYAVELRCFATAIEKTKPGTFLHCEATRLTGLLRNGHQRGVAKEQWTLFMQLCRHAGVTL